MPARGTQSKVTTGLDVQASQLIVSFGSSSSDYDQAEEIKSPGLKFAANVTLVSGIEPSYALVSIPIGEGLDEEAPTVALQGDGPCGKVRLASRCRVDWYDSVQKKKIPVMCGSIVVYNHEVGEDTATALIMDDRWLMDRVTVWGRVRAKYDPSSQTYTQWLDNSPLVFNAWGPDCIDVPGVGVRFAPEFQWGYNTNSYVEPTPGAAKTQARSWTLRDIYAYLTSLYCYGEGSLSQIIMQGGAEINRVSSWVYVPSQAAGGRELQGFDRTKRNFSLQGKTLVTALQDVCRAAGAFDLYCQPISSSFRSIITVVSMDPKRTSGVILKLPSCYNWELSRIVKDPAAIASGSVSESIVNYHDSVEILGESPWVELMASSMAPGTEDRSDDELLGAGILEPAWTTDDEAAFKALVTELGDDQDAFNYTARVYPWVYCAYRINAALFMKALIASKYETWKVVGAPRILPYLLTPNDDAGTTAAMSNPNNWIPKEIVFEYWDEYVEYWELARLEDGLMLTPERSILLVPGLRDDKKTWKADSGYDGATMAANPIRCTLAVELPSPLTSKSGNNGNGSRDPNYTGARIASNRNKFIYTGLGIPDAKDYVEYIRLATARPNGTQVPEPNLTQNYPARCTSGNELFTDKTSESEGRQPRHARERLRDVKRIEYTGTVHLSSFHTGIKPGTNIRIFGGGKILPIAVCKSVRLDANTQRVTIELASHDSRVIYDSPSMVNAPPQEPDGDPTEGNTTNPSKSKADGAEGAKSEQSEYPMSEKQKQVWDQSMKASAPTKKEEEAKSTNESIIDILNQNGAEKKPKAPPPPAAVDEEE